MLTERSMKQKACLELNCAQFSDSRASVAEASKLLFEKALEALLLCRYCRTRTNSRNVNNGTIWRAANNFKFNVYLHSLGIETLSLCAPLPTGVPTCLFVKWIVWFYSKQFEFRIISSFRCIVFSFSKRARPSLECVCTYILFDIIIVCASWCARLSALL